MFHLLLEDELLDKSPVDNEKSQLGLESLWFLNFFHPSFNKSKNLTRPVSWLNSPDPWRALNTTFDWQGCVRSPSQNDYVLQNCQVHILKISCFNVCLYIYVIYIYWSFTIITIIEVMARLSLDYPAVLGSVLILYHTYNSTSEFLLQISSRTRIIGILIQRSSIHRPASKPPNEN